MKLVRPPILISQPFCYTLVAFSLSCQSGPCKEDPTTNKNESLEAIASSVKAPAANIPPATELKERAKTAWVYKYDGSKQCGMGTPVSAEVMEKELRGIRVLTRKSENDGMMRTMVCGAATGQANLFEISVSDLKTAESIGFKLWPPKRPE